MLAFGIFFSGIVGGFIGGLIAGFLARGLSRGITASFFGGLFGAVVLALIELFGFILFDETILSRVLGSSGIAFVGLVIILTFFGILSSVLGGAIGGFVGGLSKRHSV
jgi:hypothetical protein